MINGCTLAFQHLFMLHCTKRAVPKQFLSRHLTPVGKPWNENPQCQNQMASVAPNIPLTIG